MTDLATQRVSLDLTHVLYDPSSDTSFVLALLTLSPILLMPAYAVLAVYTRELTIINMWAGQLLSEALNLVLKHIFKQERPVDSQLHLNGYGFPSSHSQYMGYFSAFLICHVYFRHRFTSTGSIVLDQLFRIVVYLGLAAWCAIVAYSRLHLLYHTPHQVKWGLVIGIVLGVSHYVCTELLSAKFPDSMFGRIRFAIVNHPISVWLQLRDGWGVWADGGREAEWKQWRTEWLKQHVRLAGKKKT
ncbi:uncharacterized protein F5147DRAFT_746768 [Suillus discolor]|uniref:Phosphatidic acid phosphatase type 2/haloperoxidase domain-containing protein n=1 Tax=Suillus discolor TaxID=1912936 RepID=A0A9P7F1M2_9AGAM|nr:uncharacterized protein F5147DRAFT_746768 [Suillus discolor]KAG2103140.1 hypothetical protein F5147DRAFT_746768 [Suillus discolor]